MDEPRETRSPRSGTRPRPGTAAFAVALLALAAAPFANANKSEWTIFEDQRTIVQSGSAVRTATLDDIEALGADTLRISVNWGDIAPDSRSTARPPFDATNSHAYPGFGPFDAALADATARGFRILVTITGPVPVWATRGARGDNRYPDANKFARFVTAVGNRYNGSVPGLPRITNWSFWNEPGHPRFLKPQKKRNSPAARSYRQLVAKGVSALRAAGHQNARVLVGELAPFPAAKGPGPLAFMRAWLCLDRKYKRLRGGAARRQGCQGFKKVDADGFAIHAYTRPVSNYRPRGDAITIGVIRRLARALDRAAKARRLPRRLPIYNTEFGIQTNPPDPFQGGSLAKQAQILNESEEISYRNSRVRSYAQYLLYDDPPETTGPKFDRFRGFQSGLRFTDGRVKPAHKAFRCPIVVHRRGSGVRVWGRVRPGMGLRELELQRKRGSRFANSGSRISTNSAGYFTVTRSSRARYRFQALDSAGNVTCTSRVAKPLA